MTDLLPSDPALVKLRKLLATGAISQSDFEELSAAFTAHNAGSGAIAQGSDSQAVGQHAVGVQGDSHAPIDNSTQTHTHFHLGKPNEGTSVLAMRRAYLGRLWRQANAVSLLAGGDNREAVRLAAVYTAVLTERLEAAGKGDPGKSQLVGGPDELAQVLGRGKPKRLSALTVLDTDHRLVLLGGPGSGKSTFVSIVAQAMAGELLGEDAEVPEPNLATLTAPLPAEEGESRGDKDKAPKPQAWRHGALLPVLVVLRDLAAQLPPAGNAVGAQDVWRYVESTLPRHSLNLHLC
jgi:hypothetical protein